MGLLRLELLLDQVVQVLPKKSALFLSLNRTCNSYRWSSFTGWSRQTIFSAGTCRSRKSNKTSRTFRSLDSLFPLWSWWTWLSCVTFRSWSSFCTSTPSRSPKTPGTSFSALSSNAWISLITWSNSHFLSSIHLAPTELVLKISNHFKLYTKIRLLSMILYL